MVDNFDIFREGERARMLLSNLRQVPVDCAGYMLARLSKGLRETDAGRLCVISCLFDCEPSSQNNQPTVSALEEEID